MLRCVDASEARCIVEEIHEKICGMHANGHKISRQIIRVGYYWLTLENDYIQFAQKCHKCQIYVDNIHVSPTELHVMTILWPFSIQDMDVVRPITPKASNGHRFIFVVINYFTQWMEAASYSNVTRLVVCKFIKKEIIFRYKLLERIISNNAFNLNNKIMEKVCAQFKIQHHNFIPYRSKIDCEQLQCIILFISKKNDKYNYLNCNLKNVIMKLFFF